MGPHNRLLLLFSSLLKLICPGLSIALGLDLGLLTMQTGTPVTKIFFVEIQQEHP